MSMITNPPILDKTGKIIAEGLKSVAAALWAEKAPIIERKAVNFYDFDATRVYSFTRSEFLGLTEMPANPAHDGLTAQGWNWSLADAKAYVEKYGVLDIGQMYITEDGKTHLYVEISHTENLTVNLKYYQSVADGVVIDWGDGSATETFATEGNAAMSHSYAEEGKYVITMDVIDECEVRLGTNNKTGTTLVGVGGLQNMFFYQGRGQIAGKDALVAVEIGKGVTTLGSAAFAYASNMRYMTIPTNVVTVWDFAFWACQKLETLTYPSGVARIGGFTNGFNYKIEVISLPASINEIGQTAFKTCTNLNRLCIPEGVTVLNQYVCSDLHTAKEIILPDTIAGAIPGYAFQHCYALEEINIPVGITSIGECAFNQCHNLRECELPEGVTTISKNAFASCFGFLDFVIPSTVTTIAAFAFLYNDGSNSFHVKPTTPPALDPKAFTFVTPNTLTIYVPYSADHSILEAYKAATGWSSKADYIVEEPAPEEVGDGA